MGADFFGVRRKPDRQRYANRLYGTDAPLGVVSPPDPAPDPQPVIEDRTEHPEPLPVAILCPGGSLHQFWKGHQDFERFSMVIAVNDAGWNNRCHWLAFSDRHIIEPVWAGTYPKPLIGCLTNRAYGKQAEHHGLKAVRPATMDNTSPAGKATSYTMVGSVWFAVQEARRLGAHVEIFGMDFNNRPTITGIHKSGSHGFARWHSEAVFLRSVWHRSIIVHGLVKPEVLAYLRGEVSDFPK